MYGCGGAGGDEGGWPHEIELGMGGDGLWRWMWEIVGEEMGDGVGG